MSTTLDTFSTTHMIDHEFNDYEFPPNTVLFQLAENEINNNSFEFDAEEEPCFSSDEDELSINNEETELETAPIGNDVEFTKNNLENNEILGTPVPQTLSSLNNHGEYAEDIENDQDIEETNEEETEDHENSITPILLTYCSKKYCIFTDAVNPDTQTQGSQSSTEHVIFSNEPELYSQSLKSFMQSIQSHFKIINDIVIFFPTLKLKFYSHIPFAEVRCLFRIFSNFSKFFTYFFPPQKLSLRDIAFLASNVNLQSNTLEIELTEEPYNFVSQYQLLINITRGTFPSPSSLSLHHHQSNHLFSSKIEELSDEESLPVEQQEQDEEEEISEQSSLTGKRQRTQDNTHSDGEENQAKRQKL